MGAFFRNLAQAYKDRATISVLVTALVYALLSNFHALYVQNRNDVALLAVCLLVSVLDTVLMFLILSINRYVYYVFVPILFLLGGFVSYFAVNYGSYVNPYTVGVVLESGGQDASQFMSPGLFLWIGIVALLSLPAVLWFRKTAVRSSKRRLYAILPFLPLIPVSWFIGSPGYDWVPWNIGRQMQEYFTERWRLEDLLANKEDISGRFQYEDRSDELIVLVVLGESARADHFHINGYERQTSPRIEELDVINFPDVWACDSSTGLAVPCILTRATAGKLEAMGTESGLPSVFRKLGFATYWLSNQEYLGYNSTIGTAVANECESLYFNNKKGTTYSMELYDEELLPKVDEFLALGNPYKFMIIHTAGSHWYYEMHYTEEYRVFKPICGTKSPSICGQEAVINSYDNSILYTDFFLGELIDRVRHRNAMVLFVSDHGESLGEDGEYVHRSGSTRPEQRQVPMFVWLSERFKASRPESDAVLRANRTARIAHGHVFHTILDCVGVTSELIEPGLSLCRAEGLTTREASPP